MSYVREAVLRDGASIVIRQVASEAADVMLAASAGGRIVGLGSYKLVEPKSAEILFDVANAQQGRGIGTLLLEHLARIARSHDVASFRAEVSADNAKMLDVFSRSGFPVHETRARDVYRVEFPTAETETFLRVAADRERRAAAKSLRAIFAPGSIAVIGASRTPGTIGRAILDNLVNDGYRGPIYPIHPQASELAGRACFRSVGAVGAAIDLAVIAVPAPAVEQVLVDCAKAGVRGAVVISAGFAEVGGAGRTAEAHLREVARSAGMRLVGPNCMGVLTTDPAVRMNATFSPVYPPTGNISLATQSGALGLAMLDHARALELGIADFVSMGNKADVSTNDVLAYWHDDPRTRVIALYLESFGNPRAFARLAPEVAREKPIVAVKSGRSAAGTRAASSHSAALASLDVGIEALFAQTGVIRVDTLEQLFDVVALLSSQPAPLGPRVGVVTNAGGPGILLADACEAHGLVLPSLGDATLAALRDFLPAQAGLGNPIDMIASAPPEHFERAIALVGADPNVDAVVAIYVPPLVTQPDDVAAAIARGAANIPRDKPIATVFMSSKGTPARLSRGERGAIPSYSFPENAAMALAAAARYEAWRKQPRGERFKLTPEQEQRIRTWVPRALSRATDGWVGFDDLASLLAIAGVRFADYRLVKPDARSAIDAANALGYPIVLKAIAPGLLHKTDAGGVALALADADAVAAAAGTMRGRIPGLTGFFVQRQIGKGVEALVGVTSDPSLGPLLVTGIGGVAVELYKDVAFRVTPVTDHDIRDMLDSLRGRALFDGFRGGAPADRAALADVIARIGAVVELVPELVELDLNPVIVLPPGDGAIAVDGRLRLRGKEQP